MLLDASAEEQHELVLVENKSVLSDFKFSVGRAANKTKGATSNGQSHQNTTGGFSQKEPVMYQTCTTCIRYSLLNSGKLFNHFVK